MSVWIEPKRGYPPVPVSDIGFECDVVEDDDTDNLERIWRATCLVRRKDLHLVLQDAPMAIVEQHDARPATRNVGLLHQVLHETGDEYASLLIVGAGLYAA